VLGSPFDDTITGGPGNDIINGVSGNDTLNGGDANDLFEALAGPDGDDTINGGLGVDRVRYAGRTERMAISLSLTVGNAGGVTTGEDDVLSAIEAAEGGEGNDELRTESLGARLLGRGGDDTLRGDTGPDLLNGGSGRDGMSGEGGDDQLVADDNEADAAVDCGGGIDRVQADAGDNARGCENFAVGRLSLSPGAIDVKAGEPARVKLSWRHPKRWRDLDRLTLRPLYDGHPIGDVRVRPAAKRLTARGAVKLARRGRLTRNGKTVTARFALSVDPAYAGERLELEVEALDTRGRRQLEPDAGTVRVAG
jgi:Ca2+-binding RTX toxin-like protein